MAVVQFGEETPARGIGDEQFAELYERAYPSLVSYCRRFHPSDAEDLAQEALMRAWLSWDPAVQDPPSWPLLVTIARRVCIDTNRSDTRRQARMRRVAASQTEPSAEDVFESRDDCGRAVAALQMLRPEQRRILELREMGGYSYNDIAEAEDATVESVRASLRRSRVALRCAFDRLGGRVVGLFMFPMVRRGRRSTAVGLNQAVSGHLGEVVAAVMATATLAAAFGSGVGSAPRPRPSPSALAAIDVDVSAAAPTAVPAAGIVARGGIAPVPPSAGAKAPQGASSTEDGAADTGVLGAGVQRPEEAAFSSLTPSPSYVRDGTIFGVGTAGAGCAATCSVLFSSTDRGATWQRLPADGFTGDRVLLPPAYPADARIFASGPTGLQASSDGGQTFATLAPIPGAAAISPGFNTGDPRIVLGGLGGWEYNDSTGTFQPLALAPRSTLSGDLTVAFSPAYSSDGVLFIGGIVPTPGDAKAGAVQRCAGATCDAAVLTGSSAAPELVSTVSPTGEPTLLAWTRQDVRSSHDGGRSFTAALPSEEGRVEAVAEAHGVLYAVVQAGAAEGPWTSAIVASPDGARGWTRTGAPLAGSLGSFVALPDGALLAGRLGHDGGGVRCSHNGGRTWATAC